MGVRARRIGFHQVRLPPDLTLGSEVLIVHTFDRFLIYEDEFGKDDRVSTFCSPVERLVTGEWLVVRLMDRKGKDVGTTALVKFELEEL